MAATIGNQQSISQPSVNNLVNNSNENQSTQQLQQQHQTRQNLPTDAASSPWKKFKAYILDDRWIVRKRNLLAHVIIWTIAAFVLLLALSIFSGRYIGLVYLIFSLAFVILFQTNYATWAACIRTFCRCLVIYSFIVSILTYSYQFQPIQKFYESFLSIELIKDIGFQNTNSIQMFYDSSLPLVLTIIIVAYLRFFQSDFIRLAYLAAEDDLSLSVPLTTTTPTINTPVTVNPTINSQSSIVTERQPNSTGESSTVINLTTSNIIGEINAPREDQTSFMVPHHNTITTTNTTTTTTANAANTIKTNTSTYRVKRKPKSKLSSIISQIFETIWRLLEVHYIKLVAYFIFRLAINDVCLLSLPLILLVIIILYSNSTWSRFACLIASYIISAIILIRMVFDLPSLSSFDIEATCPSNKSFSFLDYIGFSQKSTSTHHHIKEHLIVLFVITIRSFIQLHYDCRQHKDYELLFGIIFRGIGRQEADQSILNSIKYFFNFGFYDYGVEISCIVFVITIAHRLDIVGFIYCINLLSICLFTSRETLSTLWNVVAFLVVLLIPAQYIFRLGLPEALCITYPWQNWPPDIIYWFYLPYYLPQTNEDQILISEQAHDINLLLYDFFLLLVICAQCKVFNHARTIQSPAVDNLGIHHDLSANNFKRRYFPDNFVPLDCFSNPTTQSSYLRSTFFVSIYWITLGTVLAAGAANVSLLSLGYLIGCFIFLWLGNDTYLQKERTLIIEWNMLILYTTLVITFKLIMQFFACYMLNQDESFCRVFELLRVVCKRNVSKSLEKCESSGLKNDSYDFFWDGLCLTFLLIQRIVFGTQYFKYLVREVRAQQILASRGAELIRETQIEEAKAQDMYDREVMRAIREKMENLKSDNENTAKAWQSLLNLPHHHQIIRNAGKHLFSSLDDGPVSSVRHDNWKFKRSFIPDPFGDDMERMNEINGVSAVFTRWMKGQSLYGSASYSTLQNATSGGAAAAAGATATTIASTTAANSSNVGSCQFRAGSSSSASEKDDEQRIVAATSSDVTNATVAASAQISELLDNQTLTTSMREQHQQQLLQQQSSIHDGSNTYDVIEESDSLAYACGTRVKNFLDYINLLLYSVLLSATVQLNKFSRSYRYVSGRLNFEKSALKKMPYDLNDIRFKTDSVWKKTVIKEISETYAKSSKSQQESSKTSLHKIRSALKVMEIHQASHDGSPQSLQGASNSSLLGSQASSLGSQPNLINLETSSPTNGQTTTSYVKQHTSQRLSKDHHQLQDSSQSGRRRTASQTRHELQDPEDTFLELNMFTQFCRASGYVFASHTSLLCQLVIIFNQIFTASLFSLPLPLFTFLWGTLSVPRPTKRFWKTVITYTELAIVVKYVFQFPSFNERWKDDASPSYYPNLLGIRNVRLEYDLLLLTVLFLHRSMLKSLGQWDASDDDFSTELYNERPNTGDELQASSSALNVRKQQQQLEFDCSQSLPIIHNSNELTTPANSTSKFISKSVDIGSVATNRLTSNVRTPLSQRSLAYNSVHIGYQNQTNGIQTKNSSQTKSAGCCTCYKSLFGRIVRSVNVFFDHVLHTPYKVQTDVYTWMFLLDFINFLILIYGFWAFGGGYTNQTVASFLNENRIPSSVLLMLLLQFASIIVDRAFYLQKNLTGKLAFHVCLVIGIHIWIFFLLPATTGRAFILDESWPPKAWYIFKCLYFLFSAYQIRSGYPRRVLGNCLTKNFGYANYFSFKIYRAIPLVYDLRLYMDWIWTETTLEFRNWTIVEDMFANLFIRKCELTIEEEYPYERAKPIGRISKYFTGGAFILLILAIVWGPLLLFSMGKTVGQSNEPREFEYELQFVGYQPLLKMRATEQSIPILNQTEYDNLKKNYSSLNSQTFFNDYTVGDVARVELNGQSNAVWEISPPSKKQLIEQLVDFNNSVLILKSSWTVYRVKKQKSQNIDISISGSYQIPIDNSTENREFRESLRDMLGAPSLSSTPVGAIKYNITPAIFPEFLKVPVTGQANIVEEESGLKPNKIRLCISYMRGDDDINSPTWWQAWPSKTNNTCDESKLNILTFNDRIFTGFLALLSAPGIIGLYTTFVVFFARLIRTDPASKVIYTEIPKVDRIYALILDIYMMRESKEFELEEKLFAKLLFLYRSPEMLIEWSRRGDIPQ